MKKIFRANELEGIDGPFKIFATTDRCQAAMMELADGEVSGAFGSEHPQSDQVIFILSGGGSIRIGDEESELAEGDVALVLAGTPHQVRGPSRSLSFYAPVAYRDAE